jgi:hypothetical protein
LFALFCLNTSGQWEDRRVCFWEGVVYFATLSVRNLHSIAAQKFEAYPPDTLEPLKMRKITDYTYYKSRQAEELGIKANDRLSVLHDIGELKKGDVVTYIGFDDVDNHFGVFVFTNQKDEVVVVSGDFSSYTGPFMDELKAALLKA